VPDRGCKDVFANLSTAQRRVFLDFCVITEHSLPLWSGEGWDPAAGGFVEKLDSEGSGVQARSIYCFVNAGWGVSSKREFAWRIFVHTDL
jgi:mannose/cellobiose epimerase-like protein (N-acyl-D-glucosamine 2-epimerase family)